jgi:hypothetical protein
MAYGATLVAARAHAINEIEAWLAALDRSDDGGLRSPSLPVYGAAWYAKAHEN